MHIDLIRDYCLAKDNVEETLPFGPDTLVFKTDNKIFLLMSMDNDPISINVKCDPDKAEELREAYDAVKPGYHMNKKHWNTITIDGRLTDSFIKDQIDHSYQLVRKKNKKA